MVRWSTTAAIAAFAVVLLASGPVPAQNPSVLRGASAYGDWRADAPGVTRLITPADLPPLATQESGSNYPRGIARPASASLHVPAGFSVAAFATGLDSPRMVRVAPNGDVFVAESFAGRILVLRAADGAPQPGRSAIFARGLDQPFGIAFYPPGSDPQWVYVASNNAVERFPYRNGDLAPRGSPQRVVSQLSETSGHHWTRDLAFSLDGRRMYVSVGSGSNDAEDMERLAPAAIRANEARYAVGAAWGSEAQRADVLVFDREGDGRAIFATGLRNCVGLAVQPQAGDLWCSTNERDGLGDNLPPDYVTRVTQGGFYGWPWFYIGNHEDPTHEGERPDLASRVSVPDVLIQPHSAPLAMTFYSDAGVAAFPAEYRGDAFVALHGSWNRTRRTGYKVIRIHIRNGVPDGSYQDFLTGFVVSDAAVWGRPVGVAEAHDGALLVTDDAGGTLWRIAYAANKGGR